MGEYAKPAGEVDTRYVKYCKKEHNLALGCATVQVGTFDYYSALDPDEFSIADAEEGRLRYRGPEVPILVGASEFNAVTGGAVTIRDVTTGKTPPPIPGGVQYSLEGGEIVFGADGVARAKVDSSLDIRLNYPNCYIFSVAMLDGTETPDPTKVDEEYDSYYEIIDIGQFRQLLRSALVEQLVLGDLNLDSLQQSPARLFRIGSIQSRMESVEYVAEKIIRLRTPEDFTRSHYVEIYFDSIFQKHTAYSDDQEFRLVFSVGDASGKYIPVKQDPKILGFRGPRGKVAAS